MLRSCADILTGCAFLTGSDGFFQKLFLWRYIGTLWEIASGPVSRQDSKTAYPRNPGRKAGRQAGQTACRLPGHCWCTGGLQ